MVSHRGYGNGTANGAVNEEAPLLGRSRSTSTRPWTWRQRMAADVSCSWSDAVLLACYMVTGLLDSAAIQVWGAFVSMQTGNTIYVGLGLASLVSGTAVSPRLFKSALSVTCFCVGSFFFARFHRLFSPKRRWVLCASFAAQTVSTAAAATIITTHPPGSDTDELAWNVLVPIALIAFQSCGQAVASRALRQNALNSVVLTSIYCDLFSDQDLFALQNVTRNQRVAAPLLLFLGAVVGGVFSENAVGIAGVLWLAAGLKLCLVLAWFLWAAEKEANDDCT
ncbi:hypothetical protein B0T10DRAFT_452949 [Thelonectria olida]|uniref:DUF1275 domain protein n=1 Tax=Thelonectria olida TaxID=1576542 RepID=A0A9P8WIA8_9HYPO|nr:hypothetical protein B0T10DRAFT_452949 [Thelonectria olida]